MDKKPKKYPVENILEQLQKEEDSFQPAPGEEMTHVAGVSFVDGVGLSLGGMICPHAVCRVVSLSCRRRCRPAPSLLVLAGRCFSYRAVVLVPTIVWSCSFFACGVLVQ